MCDYYAFTFSLIVDHKLCIVYEFLSGVGVYSSDVAMLVYCLFLTQFHNGVNFVFMMGILEGYCVPIYLYKTSPVTVDEKVSEGKYL